MTKRIDTIRKEDQAFADHMKEVPKGDPRKYRYGKDQTVDGLVTLKENDKGELAGVIQGRKSRSAAVEKDQAYGGMVYEPKYLRGPAIADIISSMRDPKDAVTAEDLHKQIQESEDHQITSREAFTTSTYQSTNPKHKGQAAISLRKGDVQPATIDFKEEDKFATVAKERREREQAAAKEAREAKAESVKAEPEAKAADDLDLPY